MCGRRGGRWGWTGSTGQAVCEGPRERVGLSQDPRKRNAFLVFDSGVDVENRPEGGIKAGGRWPVGR